MTSIPQRSKPRSLSEDFERIFQEHHRIVFRTAYRVTGNAEDAEDVLQTLFLRLLRRECPAALEANPIGYLKRAAVNIALDVLRLRKRSAPADESIEIDDRTEDAVEVRQLVVSALAELPQKLAEIVVLRHVEGYDNREIAKLIGTSRGAVAVMLFRARARLKKVIEYRMEGKK
jgi:RNA polymerase sigma-70 factor, ECF subfamily